MGLWGPWGRLLKFKAAKNNMKMAMRWSKMDRIGPRFCQNDDLGLNIDFPLSKYAKI